MNAIQKYKIFSAVLSTINPLVIHKSIMPKIIVTFIAIILMLATTAQNKIRPIEQLINTTEPGWDLVLQWINQAKNKVEVLPCDSTKSKDALFKTQVTTRSLMGAIIYSTGGLLIDSGWLRILGSGHTKLNRTLPDWNKGKSFKEFGEQPAFLLVADDVVGGFFAINGGGLGSDLGKLYYLSPDNLKWEPLDLTYSEFLNFCLNGDLDKFYENLRWNGWKADVANLDGNKTYNFFPYLWTEEGKDINKVSRKAISIDEEYNFTIDMRKQLGISKSGIFND